MTRTRALTLTLALIGCLAVAYVASSIYIAGQALSAERTPLSQHPSELGLAYEDVEFSPRDEPALQLRGWWLPAGQARASVIRVHGLDGNRSSMLAFSAALLEAGYSVLVFDLRGHGESDSAQMGAGLRERDDVLGAIDFVRRRQAGADGAIFLHGNSYGAAIALLSGWREPRVRGVFADSGFASLSELVSQEVASRTGLPGWAAEALRPGVVLVGRLLHGIDIAAVNPATDAASYAYPLGLAHCRGDERIPVSHFDRIAAGLRQPASARVFADCPHSDAWEVYPSEYVELVIQYFSARISGG